VRVSCFCPGPMMTRMLRSNNFADDHPVLAMALPPEEVADLLVRAIDEERFLILSDEGDISSLVAKGNDYDAWTAQFGARRF
jgi:short-subunit dehydrogenase